MSSVPIFPRRIANARSANTPSLLGVHASIAIVLFAAALVVGVAGAWHPAYAAALTGYIVLVTILVRYPSLGVTLSILVFSYGLSPVYVAGPIRLAQIVLLASLLSVIAFWLRTKLRQGAAELGGVTRILPKGWIAMFLLMVTSTAICSTDRHASYRELMNLAVYIGLWFMVRLYVYPGRGMDSKWEQVRVALRAVRVASVFVAGQAVVSYFLLRGVSIDSHALVGQYGSHIVAEGIAGDPNYLAAFLIPGLALWIPTTKSSGDSRVPGKGSVVRMAGYGALLLIVLAMGISFSLEGILASIGGVGYLVVAGSDVKLRVGTLVCVAMAVLGVLIALDLGLANNTIFAEKGVSISQRSGLLEDSWSVVAHHPILGVGPDNLRYYLNPYLDYGFAKDAHDTYVQAAGDSGIGGLLVLVGMLGSLIYGLTKVQKALGRESLRRQQALCLRVGAAVVMISIDAFFSNGFYLYPIYLVTGLGAGVLAAGRELVSESRSVVRPSMSLR